MADCASGRLKALIIELRSRVCAIPLIYVIETMRPLPIEGLADVPSFVKGVAIVRGIPTPVLDLGALLGAASVNPERFVTVRAGKRQVALAVGAVLGVYEIESAALLELPPLLQGASKDVLEMIGRLDEQVLMVLRSAWALSDEVWQALEPLEAVS